ncbi:MAG: IS110 family RNA-guided transposase [Planctomycetota bacterium]
MEAKPFEFFNNGWGFKKFWNYISKAMKTYNLEEAIVGSESTGAYGGPLFHFLKKKGVRLVQVNPLHTKRLKELQGNSPNKTDKKDPKVIADIIELGHALTVIIPEGAAAELRRLTQARERCIQRRTALFNQLQDLLFTIFPEFLQVMKNVKTESAKYLLKHYPTPEAILEANIENLALELRKISRGKIGKKRIRELQDAARESIGIKEGRSSILLEIEEVIVLIEKSKSFIFKLEKQMSKYLSEIPYSKFILSIKGVNEITTAGIIGEVGDFRKFNSISELEKLAGLDLYEISSGKHKGTRRISKRGRHLLRKLLYFASLNMVRKGGVFHQWYRDALDRGMLKMKALVAVSRKLLGIIFSLVRNHNEYVIGYSKKQILEKAA